MDIRKHVNRLRINSNALVMLAVEG